MNDYSEKVPISFSNIRISSWILSGESWEISDSATWSALQRHFNWFAGEKEVDKGYDRRWKRAEEEGWRAVECVFFNW